jgi:thimet oligopeptidase
MPVRMAEKTVAPAVGEARDSRVSEFARMRIPRDEAAAVGRVRTSYAPGEIPRLYAAAEEKARRALDAIAAVPARRRTVENTLVAFDDAMGAFSDKIEPIVIMASVHPDAGVREEASLAEAAYETFRTGALMRDDVYRAVKARVARGEAEKRLYSVAVNGIELNGVSLSEEENRRFSGICSRIEALKAEFSQNLANDATRLEFTEAELEGVPKSALARFRRSGDGKLLVSLRRHDFIAVTENARDPETRRRVMLAYRNRAAEANTKILDEILALRREAASLMGFASWADLKARSRMAKSAENMGAFLEGLKEPLKQKCAEEVGRLLEFKKEISPGAASVDSWDLPYLETQIRKRDFRLDEEKIRKYFPLDRTLERVFEHFSRVFSVTIEETKRGEAWAPEVRRYEVKSGGTLIACFYLDLMPREGKFGSACTLPVRVARERDGERKVPVYAMLMELEPGPEGREPLLKHSQLVDLFHEFGHLMNGCLSRPKYFFLSAEYTAWDFIETPSKMFECWAYEPEILEQISSHFMHPGEKLPKDLAEGIASARDFGKGIFYARQLAYALADHSFHTSKGPVDTNAEMGSILAEMTCAPLPEGSHIAATFAHLVEEYDAGYYSYLWSETYSLEAFSRFEREGVRNAETGADFRRCLLEPANSEEPLEMMKRFLGREPGREAFLRRLKIPPEEGE